MRRRSPTRAFTLIELLVVVAVASVLLGILLPTLASAREAARRTRCLANLSGIGVGLQVYLNDHEDILPFAFPLDDSSVYGAPGQTPQELQPEGVLAVFDSVVDSMEVFICPSDRQIPASLDEAGGPVGRHSSYEYWAGVLMLAREIFNDDERPEVNISKFYGNNPNYPVFADSAERHPGGPEYDQNGLYYGDWRADWLMLDPLENSPQNAPG